MSRHECAARGCHEMTQRLLCAGCFRRVPADLRRALWSTWRALGAHRPIVPGRSPWDDYETARRACVTAASRR